MLLRARYELAVRRTRRGSEATRTSSKDTAHEDTPPALRAHQPRQPPQQQREWKGALLEAAAVSSAADDDNRAGHASPAEEGVLTEVQAQAQRMQRRPHGNDGADKASTAASVGMAAGGVAGGLMQGSGTHGAAQTPQPLTTDAPKEMEVSGMVLAMDEEEEEDGVFLYGGTRTASGSMRRHSFASSSSSSSSASTSSSFSRRKSTTGASASRASRADVKQLLPMDLNAWTCTICTLLNDPEALHCELCDTLREIKEGGLIEEGHQQQEKVIDVACSCGEQLPHQYRVQELENELAKMKTRQEQLLTMLVKVQDEAKRVKEEKEHFASYENLNKALATKALTDDDLETTEAQLESRLALVRQVRRERSCARLLALEREKREVQATDYCVICLESARTVAFGPCGHFVTCSTCGETTDTCPICRKRIVFRLKTYRN